MCSVIFKFQLQINSNCGKITSNKTICPLLFSLFPSFSAIIIIRCQSYKSKHNQAHFGFRKIKIDGFGISLKTTFEAFFYCAKPDGIINSGAIYLNIIPEKIALWAVNCMCLS